MNWLILSTTLLAHIAQTIPSASFDELPPLAPTQPPPETRSEPEPTGSEPTRSEPTRTAENQEAPSALDAAITEPKPSAAAAPALVDDGATRQAILQKHAEALEVESKGNPPEAARLLRSLTEQCAAAEAVCGRELLALLYRDLGIVLAGSEGQLFVAANAFEHALRLAPETAIPAHRHSERVDKAFAEAKKAGTADERLLSEQEEEPDPHTSKQGRLVFLVNSVTEFGVFSIESVGSAATLKQGGHLVLAGGGKSSIVLGVDLGGGAYVLKGSKGLGYMDLALAIGWVWGDKNPGFALFSSGLEYIPYGQVLLLSSHGLFGGFFGPVSVAASFSAASGTVDGYAVASLTTGLQIGLGMAARGKPR